MILRRITVKGVKCFRDEVTVGPLGDGLNMIFAPNETGKSTLIEAAGRALFDNHTVTGEAIDGLRPWGTSLAPEITLEFEERGEQWRLEKRLLSDQRCTLSRRENSAWSAVHERDAADEHVRRLLYGEAPGRGPSDLRHWGLARMLWCLRDPCVVGRADTACVVPSAIAGQLQAVLGEGTVGTAVDAVAQVVDGVYREHFTDKRGDPSKGSPIDVLRGQIEDLEERRAEAEQELREVEDAAARLEGIEHELEQLGEERERVQQQIDEHTEDAEGVEELQREITRIESELKGARAHRDEVDKDLRQLRKALDAANEARKNLEVVNGQLEEAEENLRTVRLLVEEGEERHRAAQSDRKCAAEQLERGQRLDRAIVLLSERRSLEQTLEEVEQLGRERQALAEDLGQMPCPDGADIDRADTLERGKQATRCVGSGRATPSLRPHSATEAPTLSL